MSYLLQKDALVELVIHHHPVAPPPTLSRLLDEYCTDFFRQRTHNSSNAALFCESLFALLCLANVVPINSRHPLMSPGNPRVLRLLYQQGDIAAAQATTNRVEQNLRSAMRTLDGGASHAHGLAGGLSIQMWGAVQPVVMHELGRHASEKSKAKAEASILLGSSHQPIQREPHAGGSGDPGGRTWFSRIAWVLSAGQTDHERDRVDLLTADLPDTDALSARCDINTAFRLRVHCLSSIRPRLSLLYLSVMDFGADDAKLCTSWLGSGLVWPMLMLERLGLGERAFALAGKVVEASLPAGGGSGGSGGAPPSTPWGALLSVSCTRHSPPRACVRRLSPLTRPFAPSLDIAQKASQSIGHACRGRILTASGV